MARGSSAREQLPHVVTDAREALEPTLIVEKALNRFRVHPFLAHEVEHNAGVELPRPCAHGQTIERREAHRAFEALARRERAHGCAAAEMGNHDPAFGNFGRDLAEPPRDVLVGKAVKSIATNPLRIERLGDRKAVGDLRMASMESGVEAGNLQQARLPLQDRPDRGKVIGLVQRSERYESVQAGQGPTSVMTVGSL